MEGSCELKSVYSDIVGHGRQKDALTGLLKHDESPAEELYQFAKDHAVIFSNFSDAELGAIGNLALADWYFDQKQYDAAVMRYKRLSASSELLIKKRMDDV